MRARGFIIKIFLLIILVCLNLTNFSMANQEGISSYLSRFKNMKKPVEILELGQFRDGGSINVVLKGCDGEKFYFYLNRMTNDPIGSLFVYSEFPNEGREMVPKGGVFEREIIKVLKEWLTFKYDPVEYQKKFPEQGYGDNSLLARHRYYVAKIIESVEVSRTTDIFGSVAVNRNRKKQHLEEIKFIKAISKKTWTH